MKTLKEMTTVEEQEERLKRAIAHELDLKEKLKKAQAHITEVKVNILKLQDKYPAQL
jgi:hypothetical protein